MNMNNAKCAEDIQTKVQGHLLGCFIVDIWQELPKANILSSRLNSIQIPTVVE